MKSAYKSAFGLAALSLGLAACTTAPRTPYDVRDGWREGVVEQVTTYGNVPRVAGNDCVAKSGASAPSTPVALVRYRHHDNIGQQLDSHTARQLVAISSPTAVSVGDSVFVNASTCQVSPPQRP